MKRVFLVFALISMICTTVQADDDYDKKTYQIYDNNWNRTGFIKEGRVYDNDWRPKGYIRENPLYDRDSRSRGQYKDESKQ